MKTPDDHRLHELFQAKKNGAPNAWDEILRELYPFLHRFIHHRFGNKLKNGTLQTTVVLHDFLMILEEKDHLSFNGHGSIMAFASKVIRNYLADYYKKKNTIKRGANMTIHAIDSQEVSVNFTNAEFLINFNLVMDELEKLNPNSRRIIDLKITAGFSNLKTAELLDMTEYQVNKEYEFCCAWLRKQLKTTKTSRNA